MPDFYNVKKWIGKGKALFEKVKNEGNNVLFYHHRRVETEKSFTGVSVNLLEQVYGKGNNKVWGRVMEIYRLATGGEKPTKKATIGDELALVIQCGYGEKPKILTNYAFKNRLDREKDMDVPEFGEGKHNARAWCIWVDSFPRSPAGEYCGFPTYTRFSRQAFDRSVEQPYATLFDFEPKAKHDQTQYGDPLYFATFNADGNRYGIRLDHTTESGFKVVRVDESTGREG